MKTATTTPSWRKPWHEYGQSVESKMGQKSEAKPIKEFKRGARS